MATLHERLARIIDGLPSGSAVTLSADWLRAQLERDGREDKDGVSDLTVGELAEELGRSVSAVRGWLAVKLVPGAYKLRGREWRVPRAGLRQFLDQEAGRRRQTASGVRSGQEADLRSWRKLPGRHQAREENSGTTR